MRRPLFGLLCLFLLGNVCLAGQPGETREERDARMKWWREAKYGMFIHWGIYAVPAGQWNGKEIAPGGGGEWILEQAKIPVKDYMPLAKDFNPTEFDADAWVALAKSAGMKYIVITSKHHDGFAMFKSAHPFNIYDATGFKRDPLKELAEACKKQGMKLGFYYSQDQDWTAPGGGAMHGHWDPAQDGSFEEYFRTKALPQLRELLTNYPDAPVIIWFDTPSKNMTPELSAEVLALLKDHPNIIWNNRLGGGDHGDTETPEQFVPPSGFRDRDWETCMTMNDTWGFRTDDENWKSTEKLLHNLIDIVSKGGNYLLNVGPDAKGVIPRPQVERLEQIGAWLKVNGEAIYGTSASPFPRPLPWGRVTRKGDRLFLSVFNWPKDGRLVVPMKNSVKKAFLLTVPLSPLATKQTSEGLVIDVPAEAPDAIASVIVLDVEGTVDLLPPPPVAQGEDGGFQLLAADANLSNAKGEAAGTTVEVRDGKPNIGFWSKAEDRAEWILDVKKPGRFKVALEYAAPENAQFLLSSGDSKVEGEFASTGRWEEFKTIEAGSLEISKAGKVTVLLEPRNMRGSFCNLRSIRLVPIE